MDVLRISESRVLLVHTGLDVLDIQSRIVVGIIHRTQKFEVDRLDRLSH